MLKKIMAFAFVAALLIALAVPMFGSVGTAQAMVKNPVWEEGAPGLNRADGPGGPLAVSAAPSTGLR